MNNVIITGRLTRDPELRYLQGGNNTAVARFMVAVDKNLSKEKKQELESKNQPTADFINIVAWGKLGENAAKYTSKGLRVLVAGRIQTGSYEKDGQKFYTTEIFASNIEFLDWKSESSNNNSNTSNDDYHDDFNYEADFNHSSDGRIPF